MSDKNKLQHTMMTEIEAITLLNQSLIMSALEMLVLDMSVDMKNLLAEQAERTKNFVSRYDYD